MHGLLATIGLAACLMLGGCTDYLKDPVDIATADAPKAITLDNVSSHETDGNLNWRWFLGPEASVSFELEKDRPVKLDAIAYSRMPGMTARILLNGEELGMLETPEAGPYAFTFAINAKKGKNRLAFVFSDWNHGKATFAPDDSRPMALAFYRLLMTPS